MFAYMCERVLVGFWLLLSRFVCHLGEKVSKGDNRSYFRRRQCLKFRYRHDVDISRFTENI